MHPVFARAGGGEVFGGGGFSGGGFSSGGSSGFFFLPFFFGGGNSIFGIFFFIFIIFILPYLIRRMQRGSGFFQYPYQQRRNAYPLNNPDLSVIIADDPAFNKDRFIDKVQTAFFAIQASWMKKDLTQIRGFMTDAQYQRLQVQIMDMIRRGVTNNLEQIAVADVEIVKVLRDEKYETIECRIHASMIDYKTDDKTGKVIDGNNRIANEFYEYWTFMRSALVKTKETDSIISKTCPNCGAPLDINEFGKCKYCGAYIISGEFDWVLSNISQEVV